MTNIKLFKLITEGVYDQGILKAIFLAGGPGSGKSWVGKQIFGIDSEETIRSFSNFGLKQVANDIQFEKMLKQQGYDPKDLQNLPPEEFKKLTVGDNSLRAKAKAIIDKQKDFFKQGRLGLIIDGTGQNYEKTRNQKKVLESLGYDVGMVFVNTDLETAQKRNQRRKRQLPIDLIEELWHTVQKNLGKYQEMFGDNFVIVDNSAEEGEEFFKQYNKPQIKKVEKFLKAPVENEAGKVWIEFQMQTRNRLK